MFASRAWTRPRDHLCRSTIAPRRSRPITWNAFLPMSMPIVATGEFDLLDMVVLLCFIRPIQALFAEGREHGRTIPLADFPRTKTLEGRGARRFSVQLGRPTLCAS